MRAKLKAKAEQISQEPLSVSLVEHNPISSASITPPLDSRIERILEEASRREEKYMQIIAAQQKQLDSTTKQFLKELKSLQDQFSAFITHASQKRNELSFEKIGLKYACGSTNIPVKRGRTDKFSLITPLKDKLHPYLQCCFTFFYFTAFLQDYLSEPLPTYLTLKFSLPNSAHELAMRVVREQSEMEDIHNLIEHVPFQILLTNEKRAAVQFQIPCEAEAISHFQTGQVQFELLETDSQLLYAVGKSDLSSLLYYQQRRSEWPEKSIAFYSVIDGTKRAEISVRLRNQLCYREQLVHHKAQSTQPMELRTIRHNDTETRIMQRINQFKQVQSHVTLSPTEITLDRNLLMHRQQRELEHILQVKHSQKEALMGKLFQEALQQYYLHQCVSGAPKYLLFPFTNPSHSYLTLQLSATLDSEHAKHVTMHFQSPSAIKLLQETGLLSGQADYHYEFNDKDQVIVRLPPDFTATFVLKWISYAQGSFNLKVVVKQETQGPLQSYLVRVHVKHPSAPEKIYLYNYLSKQSIFALALQSPTPKKCVSVCKEIEAQWGSLPEQHKQSTQKIEDLGQLIGNAFENSNSRRDAYTQLNVQVKHFVLGVRSEFLYVYDIDCTSLITCYELRLHSYLAWQGLGSLRISQIKTYSTEFLLDETATAERKDLRVSFHSSHPRCVVRCEDRQTIDCVINKPYRLEIRMQFFEPVKAVIIHATLRERVVKQWLLKIPMDPINYKEVYSLRCQQKVPINFPFELENKAKEERLFKLYSSNLSLLSPPMGAIPLVGKQFTKIQLLFKVDRRAEECSVVLAVHDEDTIDLYLFELIVE